MIRFLFLLINALYNSENSSNSLSKGLIDDDGES